MNTDSTPILQGMMDIVFKGNMIYLAPFLLILMSVLFGDRLIDLIFNSINDKRRRY